MHGGAGTCNVYWEPIEGNGSRILLRYFGRWTKRRQHRLENAVAQNEMMKQGGGGMETRQPDDRVSQDRMDIRDGRSEIMGRRQHRFDGPDAEQRERMAFQPGTRNRGERYGQQP